MSRLSAYGNVVSTAGLIGFLAVMPGAGSGCAQSLNDVVRGINNVLNPNDARRLEEQAYQHGRWDEQRYWHDYRAGLESPNRSRCDYGSDGGDRGRYDYGGAYRNGGEYGERGDRSSQPDYPRDQYYRFDPRQY